MLRINPQNLKNENLNVKDQKISNLYPLSEKLINIQNDLCRKLECLHFDSCIKYIYNPLIYAKNLHVFFINKYFENSTKKVIFLGINPGPWGMCQTGIVFGEKNHVKDWLKITGTVDKLIQEHPKKKILGFDCQRTEISGKKFWGFFKTLCGMPENFFKHSFVYNLCPLAFISESGKNITPPEIKNRNTRELLYSICRDAFIDIIVEFNFKIIVAIGKFAEKEAIKALKKRDISDVKVYCIPHPSPRNAKNLGNWESITLSKLQEFNLMKYFKN